MSCFNRRRHRVEWVAILQVGPEPPGFLVEPLSSEVASPRLIAMEWEP